MIGMRSDSNKRTAFFGKITDSSKTSLKKSTVSPDRPQTQDKESHSDTPIFRDSRPVIQSSIMTPLIKTKFNKVLLFKNEVGQYQAKLHTVSGEIIDLPSSQIFGKNQLGREVPFGDIPTYQHPFYTRPLILEDGRKLLLQTTQLAGGLGTVHESVEGFIARTDSGYYIETEACTGITNKEEATAVFKAIERMHRFQPTEEITIELNGFLYTAVPKENFSIIKKTPVAVTSSATTLSTAPPENIEHFYHDTFIPPFGKEGIPLLAYLGDSLSTGNNALHLPMSIEDLPHCFPHLKPEEIRVIGGPTNREEDYFCCYDHVLWDSTYEIRGENYNQNFAKARIIELKEAGILGEPTEIPQDGSRHIATYHSGDSMPHVSIQEPGTHLHRHKMSGGGMILADPQHMIGGSYDRVFYYPILERS